MTHFSVPHGGVIIADRDISRCRALDTALTAAGYDCARAHSVIAARGLLAETRSGLLVGQQGLLYGRDRPLVDVLLEDERLLRETRVIAYSARCRDLPMRYRARFPCDAFVRWTGNADALVHAVESVAEIPSRSDRHRHDLLRELLLLDAMLDTITRTARARPAEARMRQSSR